MAAPRPAPAPELPVPMLHPATASRLIIHLINLLLLTSLRVCHVAMCSWELWIGAASNLVCCWVFIVVIRKKFCRYRDCLLLYATKAFLRECSFWGEKSYWCNLIKVGIKFHNSALLSNQTQRTPRNNKSLQSTEVKVNHIFLNNKLLEEMLP